MEGKRNLTLKFKINFPTDSLHTFPSNLTAATDKLFFPLSVQILLVKRRRVQRARVDCANSSSLRVCRLMFELIRQWGYRVAEGGHLEDSKIPRRNERFVPHPLQSSGNRVPEHVDMQSSSVFRDIPWPLFPLINSGQQRPIVVRCRGWNICERRSSTLWQWQWLVTESVSFLPWNHKFSRYLRLSSARFYRSI